MTTSDSSLHMKIFARIGDNGFPIPHPSTCLNNFPLKLKTDPLVPLHNTNRSLNIGFGAIWWSLVVDKI